MGNGPPPALITDLQRIRAYAEGMRLVDADGADPALRVALADFLRRHGPAVIAAWVPHVGQTMGIPADDPYAQSGEPPVWREFRDIIAESGLTLRLTPIQKWEFYDAVASPDHVLTIQTADQALWGNVLLTMGCRTA